MTTDTTCEREMVDTAARVLRLDQAATDGPWVHMRRELEPSDLFKRERTEWADRQLWLERSFVETEWHHPQLEGPIPINNIAFSAYTHPSPYPFIEPKDADLIAFYRTAAPALAHEVIALRAEVARQRGVVAAAHVREDAVTVAHYAFYESEAEENSAEYRRLWDEYETALSAIVAAHDARQERHP